MTAREQFTNGAPPQRLKPKRRKPQRMQWTEAEWDKWMKDNGRR